MEATTSSSLCRLEVALSSGSESSIEDCVSSLLQLSSQDALQQLQLMSQSDHLVDLLWRRSLLRVQLAREPDCVQHLLFQWSRLADAAGQRHMVSLLPSLLRAAITLQSPDCQAVVLSVTRNNNVSMPVVLRSVDSLQKTPSRVVSEGNAKKEEQEGEEMEEEDLMCSLGGEMGRAVRIGLGMYGMGVVDVNASSRSMMARAAEEWAQNASLELPRGAVRHLVMALARIAASTQEGKEKEEAKKQAIQALAAWKKRSDRDANPHLQLLTTSVLARFPQQPTTKTTTQEEQKGKEEQETVVV